MTILFNLVFDMDQSPFPSICEYLRKTRKPNQLVLCTVYIFFVQDLLFTVTNFRYLCSGVRKKAVFHLTFI